MIKNKKLRKRIKKRIKELKKYKLAEQFTQWRIDNYKTILNAKTMYSTKVVKYVLQLEKSKVICHHKIADTNNSAWKFKYSNEKLIKYCPICGYTKVIKKKNIKYNQDIADKITDIINMSNIIIDTQCHHYYPDGRDAVKNGICTICHYKINR